MTIYIFGNPDINDDSLPLRILPDLRRNFPDIKFEVKDPNEEWNAQEELTIIDTAIGLIEITVFDSLEKFAQVPRVSMHDFDALTNLRLLQKPGKLKKIKIIAVPQTLSEPEAIKGISALL